MESEFFPVVGGEVRSFLYCAQARARNTRTDPVSLLTYTESHNIITNRHSKQQASDANMVNHTFPFLYIYTFLPLVQCHHNLAFSQAYAFKNNINKYF